MKGFRKWIRSTPQYPTIPEEHSEAEECARLTSDLEQNEMMFKRIFDNCSDIVFRIVHLAGQKQWIVIFLACSVEEEMIDKHILQPLIARNNQHEQSTVQTEALDDLMISAAKTYVTSSVTDIVNHLLDGHAIVLTRADSNAMMIKVKGTKQRSLEEPSSEPVIRGPRDGFIENISTNMGLIRSRLKTSTTKNGSQLRSGSCLKPQ